MLLSDREDEMSGNTLWILAALFMAGVFVFGLYMSRRKT